MAKYQSLVRTYHVTQERVVVVHASSPADAVRRAALIFDGKDHDEISTIRPIYISAREEY
jgi:hypothetical protein